MFHNQKNSKCQGDVGLSVAIGWFVIQGYTVCVPLTDSQDYDLIVDKNHILSRVQVKTTSHKPKKNFAVSLKVSGGNRSGTGKVKLFDPNAVELLFVLTEDGLGYLIPSKEIKAKRQLLLCKKYEKFTVMPYAAKA